MRGLGKKQLTSLIVVMILLLCGWYCNPQTWVSRANAILVELGPATTVLANLLPLLGVPIPDSVTQGVNEWLPRVQNDFTQLSSELTKAQNDVATNQDTQARINALIQTTQQDIGSILPVLRVLDPTTQKRVTNIVNALAAGVISVETIINIAEGKTQLKAVPSGDKLSASGKDFKNNFNHTLKANFPNAQGVK